jgi:hypothetical protein
MSKFLKNLPSEIKELNSSNSSQIRMMIKVARGINQLK